jgi:hypothetical protein
MDDEGWYVTGNVLTAAANEIVALDREAQIVRLAAVIYDSGCDLVRLWCLASRDPIVNEAMSRVRELRGIPVKDEA